MEESVGAGGEGSEDGTDVGLGVSDEDRDEEANIRVRRPGVEDMGILLASPPPTEILDVKKSDEGVGKIAWWDTERETARSKERDVAIIR